MFRKPENKCIIMRHTQNTATFIQKLNIPFNHRFFYIYHTKTNPGILLALLTDMLTKNKENGKTNMKPCNTNILRTIDMANTMMELADTGDMEREDDGCGILFGLMRDAAYKIRTQAEKEKIKHQESGKWD